MIVDLRSDTVTRPTAEMYEAMLSADLGDDVLGDDPTVEALEGLAAKMLKKEAAVFVPSGTMGNQIAVRSWTNPGDGIIVEQDAHIVFYESGGPGAHSGVVTWTLPSSNGVMDTSLVRSRINPGSIHTPATRLLCLESSHNRAGGTVIPLEAMREYRQIASEAGINVHLDGARIFNAAAFLNVSAADISEYADSVNFCLSKGLSCPIGSVLCGPADFIEKARRHRKRMGGGMRQAGILAAAGIYALNNLVSRLADDHRRAHDFAEYINGLPGLAVDLETVQTNIVGVRTDSPAAEWQSRLGDSAVRCFATGANRLRCVFHREIDDEKLDFAKTTFCNLASSV